LTQAPADTPNLVPPFAMDGLTSSPSPSGVGWTCQGWDGYHEVELPNAVDGSANRDAVGSPSSSSVSRPRSDGGGGVALLCRGHLRSFDPAKGFGFLACDTVRGGDVFLHANAVVGDLPPACGSIGGTGNQNYSNASGSVMEFRVEWRNGRPRALDARLVDESAEQAAGPLSVPGRAATTAARAAGEDVEGSGQQLPQPLERLSRTLVALLRHRATQEGIDLRNDGFARLADVLAVPQAQRAAMETLAGEAERLEAESFFAGQRGVEENIPAALLTAVREVVSCSTSRGQPRFELTEEIREGDGACEFWIRATHKHSLRSVYVSYKAPPSVPTAPSAAPLLQADAAAYEPSAWQETADSSAEVGQQSSSPNWAELLGDDRQSRSSVMSHSTPVAALAAPTPRPRTPAAVPSTALATVAAATGAAAQAAPPRTVPPRVVAPRTWDSVAVKWPPAPHQAGTSPIAEPTESPAASGGNAPEAQPSATNWAELLGDDRQSSRLAASRHTGLVTSRAPPPLPSCSTGAAAASEKAPSADTSMAQCSAQPPSIGVPRKVPPRVIPPRIVSAPAADLDVSAAVCEKRVPVYVPPRIQTSSTCSTECNEQWHRGRVKSFFPEKGFGFVTCDIVQVDVFLPANVMEGPPLPKVVAAPGAEPAGPLVDFTLEWKGGRPRVGKVRLAPEQEQEVNGENNAATPTWPASKACLDVDADRWDTLSILLKQLLMVMPDDAPIAVRDYLSRFAQK